MKAPSGKWLHDLLFAQSTEARYGSGEMKADARQQNHSGEWFKHQGLREAVNERTL